MSSIACQGFKGVDCTGMFLAALIFHLYQSQPVSSDLFSYTFTSEFVQKVLSDDSLKQAVYFYFFVECRCHWHLLLIILFLR